MKGQVKSVVIHRQALQKISPRVSPHLSTSASRQSSSRPIARSSNQRSTGYEYSEMTYESSLKDKKGVDPTFISTIDDPRMIILREKIEEGENLDDVSNDDLKLLIAHTREYEQNCAALRKYEKAHEAQEILRVIKAEIETRKNRTEPDQEAIDQCERDIEERNEEFVN